jgi:hypothetical protein
MTHLLANEAPLASSRIVMHVIIHHHASSHIIFECRSNHTLEVTVLKTVAAGCWLLAAGCWLLAAGCWLLAAGCWLLAAGCWLLAVDDMCTCC